MRYDIETAKLCCDYCKTMCEVEEHPFHAEQAKQDVYEVTEFSCPQCGGTIIATDHAAVGICPYCRESALLEGRLSEKRKPEYIIPFSVTKEQCSKSYLKAARKTWCLPRGMLDEKYLDGFQGIYLPYWVYHVTQKGHFYLPAFVTKSQGRNSSTYYASVTGEIDADFPWICFDAAADFPDEASENINLYAIDAAKPFSAAYLSGFCADTADVDADVYREDAKDAAVFFTMDEMSHMYSNSSDSAERSSLDLNTDVEENLHTEVEGVRSGLFPVWFLTWKHKKGRVFSAVNGSTGNLSTDFPVSAALFAVMTLLMALPLFFLYRFATDGLTWLHPAWLQFAGLLFLNEILSLHTRTVRWCAEGYDLVPDRGENKEKGSGGYRQNIYQLSRLTGYNGNQFEFVKRLNLHSPVMSMNCKKQKRAGRRQLEIILFPLAYIGFMSVTTLCMMALDVIKNGSSWSDNWAEVLWMAGYAGIALKVITAGIVGVRIIMLILEYWSYEGKRENLRMYLELILINLLQAFPIMIMFLTETKPVTQALAAGSMALIGVLSCALQIFHINRRVSRTQTSYHKAVTGAAAAGLFLLLCAAMTIPGEGDTVLQREDVNPAYSVEMQTYLENELDLEGKFAPVEMVTPVALSLLTAMWINMFLVRWTRRMTVDPADILKRKDGRKINCTEVKVSVGARKLPLE